MTRRRWTWGCVLVAGAALALTVVAPATATTISVEQSILKIADEDGDPNALDVRRTALGYDVFDDYSRLRPKPGSDCFSVRVHRVVCLTAMVARVEVDAGDGADVVLFEGVEVPVEVKGGPGDDLIEGGGTDDHLFGGPGDDAILGGAGNDLLDGETGGDLLEGGTGGDRLLGQEGADILDGQQDSSDILVGGDGPDLLRGGAGNDDLKGGDGADVLVTGPGKDTADTGFGDPAIDTPAGGDTVFTTRSPGLPPDTVVCRPAGPTDSGRLAASACAPEPGERVPVVWPPLPEGDSPADLTLSARAARIRRTGKLKPSYPVTVLSSGSAKRLKVTLRVEFHTPMTIDVKLFGAKKRPLGGFTQRVTTHQPYRFKNRKAVSGVRTATAACCKVATR